MIRVLLADDHTLLREGVRSLLTTFSEFEVVGEASNGREAVRLARKLMPDVILMDVSMPELNGLEALTQLPPEVRPIILSVNATEEYVLQALRAGAAGYVLKTMSGEELKTAIKAVHAGEKYLSPTVNKHVIRVYLEKVGNSTGETALQRLPTRLRQTLQLLAEGHGTKEIAKKMSVAPKTVEGYKTQLMASLRIRDMPGLVKYALKMGVISLEEWDDPTMG